MKKMIFLMMFYSLAANSSNIDLKITSQLKMGNSSAQTTSASVVAELGKELTIPFKDNANLKLKVKVTESRPFPEANSPSELLFNVKILEVKNGKEVVLSSPRVITAFDTEATITLDDSNKNESMKITILPSKIIQKI